MTHIAEFPTLYPAPLVDLQRANGASQTAAWFARAADGQRLFIKHDAQASGLLEAEAEGLQALRDGQALRIPHIFLHNAHWLVMEAIARETAQAAFWKALAEGLVRLHQHRGRPGWPSNNFLGRSVQYNQWQDLGWADFFWQRRILPQVDQLRHRQIWTPADELFLPELKHRVLELLGCVDEVPSLLHGDLWSGNILCGEGQTPVLIDPAVYYGHRECDLAMSELFGGFAPSFYQHYQALWPLAPAYPKRRLVYNFYHKLNHANLYGSGYIWDVKKTLRDICRSASRQPPMAENV